MADENEKNEQAETPQGDEVQATDWKAEARKWEARAKKSQAAEAELEKLKAANMTEQEKAIARAEAAEAELTALKAEAERMAAAREVAASTGVPLELLEYCRDKDAMAAFAKAYVDNAPKAHAAPSAPTTRQKGGGQLSARDAFAVYANEVINK